MKEITLSAVHAAEIENLLQLILFELTTMPPLPGCSPDGYFPIVNAAKSAKSILNIFEIERKHEDALQKYYREKDEPKQP